MTDLENIKKLLFERICTCRETLAELIRQVLKEMKKLKKFTKIKNKNMPH